MVSISTDTRNIVDYYKLWEHDAILGDLDKNRFNYSIVCANISGDYNVAGIVRNSNAFLANEIVVYGKKKFDRRGAVGTHKYEHVFHANTIDSLKQLLEKHGDYIVVAIDNIATAESLEQFQWPKDRHVVMIFGEEGTGIPAELVALADKTLFIKQYGSVRSLNVAVAAGIAMCLYTSQVQGELK